MQMRKLLFLLPLGFSFAQAEAAHQQTAPSQTRFVLQVPSGAKSILVHLDGYTSTASVLSGVREVVLSVKLAPTGIECSFEQHSGGTTTTNSLSSQTPITFKPWPKAQSSLSLRLNEWNSLWEGKSNTKATVKLSGKTATSSTFTLNSEKLTLQVLFSPKSSDKIKGNIQPPRLP